MSGISKRILGCGLAAAVIFSSLTFVSAEKTDNGPLQDNTHIIYDGILDYSEYLEKYPAENSATDEIIINAADYTAVEPEASFKKLGSYEDRKSVLLCEPNASRVEYRFNAPSNGWYTIGAEYFPLNTERSKEDVSLYINGELPFYQADALSFNFSFVPEAKEVFVNSTGDEYACRRVANKAWTASSFRNPDNDYDGNLKFYLQKGENTISFHFDKDCNFVLGSVKISAVKELPSYKDYVAKKSTEKGNGIIITQAESAVLQSDSVVVPVCDQTDPLCDPVSVSDLKINTVDAAWRSHGQWLEWEIEVKESGWYQLYSRYKQNTLKGLSVKRAVYIDGEIPFSEAECIAFPYASSWGTAAVCDENGEPYSFYLEKGTRRIRMECVLGELEKVIRGIDDIVYDMNTLYRLVIMVTSTTTDKYRDYRLGEELPELSGQLTECAEKLEGFHSSITELSGGRNADSAILATTAAQLRSMAEDVDTVPQRLSSWESNIGSISSWVLTIREQPLQMDYFVFAQENAEIPDGKANIAERFIYSIQRFFYSFIKDYNALGSDKDKSKSISVWISTGRDQSETIWRMANDLFTPQTDISVQVKLVNATMIEAFLSGQAPDLTVQAARDLPINLAVRGALLNLATFSDFDTVKGWFAEDALTPYTFQDSVYGLPDSQSFNMLFYRKDVFAELGLSVPKTWEEFINVANQLHLRQLETGVPIDIDTSLFYTLLYQNKGEIFTEDLSTTLLDSRVAINSFSQWTDLFTETGLPLSYDFFNRFRSGEMPMAIVPYINYNQLSAAAPEIRNLWGMTEIPGTLQQDGTICRSESATGTATVILSSTKNPQEAWEFVRWWVGEQAQIRYAQDIESRVGTIGRVACANMAALKAMQYPTAVRETLLNQRNEVIEVPQVPGNYYLDRDLLNAFRDVVYNGRNAKESILDYGKRINSEIERKRKELGIE